MENISHYVNKRANKKRGSRKEMLFQTFIAKNLSQMLIKTEAQLNHSARV